MKNGVKKKIYPYLIAGIIGTFSLTGCGEDDEKDGKEVIQVVALQTEGKVLEAGLHSFSMVYDNLGDYDCDKDTIQLDGIDGYKPVAFIKGTTSEGLFKSSYKYASVLFTNIEDVSVSCDTSPGTVVTSKYQKLETNVINTYQHLLIEPVTIKNDAYIEHDNLCFPQHEGYEIVDFKDISNNGDVTVAILYTNIEPVQVSNFSIQGSKIKSIEFGRPLARETSENSIDNNEIENTKVYTKRK